MDLKFTFGASNPLPLAEGAGSASAAPSASSELELRVTLPSGGTGDGTSTLICEGLSGDGVSYARTERRVEDPASPSQLAAGVRSALARAGAELPEPLLGSVTGVRLVLSGAEAAVLSELGVAMGPDPRADGFAAIDEALQARTGIPAGTPIRVG